MEIIKTKLNHIIPDSKAELISYNNRSLTDTKSPSIILVPGGAYTHIDFDQSEKVALRFMSAGFHVSILRYSFLDEHQPLYPAPLLELAEAMQVTHQNADAWQINPQKISLIGFSVGGHIVSNFNNLWNSTWLNKLTQINSSILKPFSTILGFPVITPKDGFPDESTLAKWTDDPEFIAADQHVNSDNVPTFIWTTTDDSLVSSQNAVDYFLALRSNSIPVELHAFQHGPHGMVLADATTAYDDSHINQRIATWVTGVLDWLQELS